MMLVALFVILGHATTALLLSWGYFRRYAISRPPIGVFNLRDIAIMIGGIALMPYLYLALPRWIVAGLLAVGVLSALFFMAEPVLRRRWAIWLAMIALAGADIWMALVFGAASAPFFATNNLVLTLVVVGLTNLWGQSGMKARDVALLAGVLTIYDIIVTWQLTQTSDLFRGLSGLPFAPIVAWPVGSTGLWLGIGLGDLLLAAVFPLVVRKAFGRIAGRAALMIGVGAIGAVMALPILGFVQTAFPVMVVLGPLTVLQYLVYRRRHGPERTTWQYLQSEPAHRSSAPSI
jgi:hypothetical protein